MLDNLTLRKAYVNYLLKYFKNGDLAVTLTYKEKKSQFKNFYTHDYVQAGKDLAYLLKIINCKIYGKDYKRKGMYLNNAHVFETTKYNGLHVHMILEYPNNIKYSAEELKELILSTWLGMNCSGVHAANDVQVMTMFEGWIYYCFKSIEKNNEARCDIVNWNLKH